MSDNLELKPLREQARERQEWQEKMRERSEYRVPLRKDQKREESAQNNLHMQKDSFKGELYNEEDFDHFNYFNALRDKQLALEKTDNEELEAFKIRFGNPHSSRSSNVVTIEEKNKQEVSLVKQAVNATQIHLSTKVQVRAKLAGNTNKSNGTTATATVNDGESTNKNEINSKRSAPESEKVTEPTLLKKAKSNEDKSPAQNLSALLGYSEKPGLGALLGYSDSDSESN